MTQKPTTKDDDARRAALSLLAQGFANLSDVARLAGVSRQLVRFWCDQDGLDWRKSRNTFLAKSWRKALKG